jgi:catechol 2,3-dioxygenase-like lactoylglutathione lyase family enzyme
MIDHMTFRVSDIAKTRAFYTPVLATVGYALAVDTRHGDVNILGYGMPDTAAAHGFKIDSWFIDGPSPHGAPATTGCHLCWSAPNRAAVDAFHRAAIAHGGRDNGAPGLRPHYHSDYYGAFVIDPEGNNVEAVCHAPS